MDSRSFPFLHVGQNSWTIERPSSQRADLTKEDKVATSPSTSEMSGTYNYFGFNRTTYINCKT